MKSFLVCQAVVFNEWTQILWWSYNRWLCLCFWCRQRSAVQAGIQRPNHKLPCYSGAHSWDLWIDDCLVFWFFFSVVGLFDWFFLPSYVRISKLALGYIFRGQIWCMFQLSGVLHLPCFHSIWGEILCCELHSNKDHKTACLLCFYELWEAFQQEMLNEC